MPLVGSASVVNLLLSALSGLLLSGAFEPIAKWWLAPTAIIVHMYAINRSDRKLLSAFIFAFTFNAILLHWTSTYVGSTPWIILAFGLSILYMPLALIGRWGIAAYPLIFVILEEVRNRFPFGGFGWARLAYSQADSPYALIAARGGAIALSAMTLLIAGFAYFAFTKRVKILFLVPLLTLLIPNNIIEVVKALESKLSDRREVLNKLEEKATASGSDNSWNRYESVDEAYAYGLELKSLLEDYLADFIEWDDLTIDLGDIVSKSGSEMMYRLERAQW